MSEVLCCPRGHQWQRPEQVKDRGVCPVCGAAATEPAPVGGLDLLQTTILPGSAASGTPGTDVLEATIFPEGLPSAGAAKTELQTLELSIATKPAARDTSPAGQTVADGGAVKLRDPGEQTVALPHPPQDAPAAAWDQTADLPGGVSANSGDTVDTTQAWQHPPTRQPAGNQAATLWLGDQAAQEDAPTVGAAAAQATHKVRLPGMADKQTVPGYEILSELGRGAMGVVYKARQIGLNRVVALKMILAGGHASQLDLIRFRTEAESVAQFQHVNIVQIYEIGEQDGLPYFSLEFVDGGSLQQKIAGTPQPAYQVAELMKSLAEAMDSAHQRGIIHRDLKPANVMLTKDGKPKITDFGLAKRFQEDTGQTGEGSILGTPSYMSPEQAEGKTKEIGPPADIYALGAITYELLTGRPPFRGETLLDTLLMVQSQEPVPPSRLQPKTPRDLETICLKCLEKQPGKRYATAGEMARDLGRFLNHEPILARPASVWERTGKWCRRRPAVAALIGVSVLAVFSLMGGGFLLAAQEAARANAEQRLRQDAEEARQTAEQQRDRADANFRRAEEYFQQAREAVDQLLTDIGQERLALEPRMEQVRRALLEKALKHYKEFLNAKGDDRTLRRETGRAHQRVADIYALLGRHDEAEADYRSALDFFTKLLKDHPDDTRYQQDKAATYNNLGALLKDTGRLREAEKAHEEALILRQRLYRAERQKPEYGQELAASYYNHGEVLQRLGRSQQAEDDLNQALGLLDRLIQDEPKPVYRLEAARCYERLSDVRASQGHFEQAEKDLHRAGQILGQLTKNNPDQPDFRYLWAVSQKNLGNLLRDAKPAEARKAYEQAQYLCNELYSDFPTVSLYRQELAATCNSLAVLLLALGENPASEENTQIALRIQVDLARDFPKVPVYRRNLAASYEDRGIQLMNQERYAEARRELDRALILLTKVVEESPEVPGYQNDLARTHGNLGVVLTKQEQYKLAEKSYCQAICLAQPLVNDFPKIHKYQHDLARTQRNLGTLLRLTNQMKEAEDTYRTAVEAFTQLRDRYPYEVDYRVELAESLNNLGAFLFKDNRPQEAERSFAQALTLYTRLVEELPGMVGHRLGMARTHGYLGEVQAKRKQFKEPEDNYRKAAVALEQFREPLRDSPAVLEIRVHQYRNLGYLYADNDHAADAEKTWKHALALQEKLVASAPKAAEYRIALAGIWYDLADLSIRDNRPTEACQGVREFLRQQLAARDLSQLSAEQREEFTKAFGDRAMKVIQAAVDRGFKDVDFFKHPEFEPLRSRDDFKKLFNKT